MSKVEIEIPDDRWFRGEWQFRPQDKQLCVVIHKYGGQTPWICQYRKSDWIHPKKDYFLDVSEKWNLDSLGIEEWNPSFMEWWGGLTAGNLSGFRKMWRNGFLRRLRSGLRRMSK